MCNIGGFEGIRDNMEVKLLEQKIWPKIGNRGRGNKRKDGLGHLFQEEESPSLYFRYFLPGAESFFKGTLAIFLNT